MGYFIHFLTISFGWNFFCDATVTVSLINNANGVDKLECRSDGIVSCRINPYAGLISWEINRTTYATCAPGCAENPTFTRNYSPTYDVVNGVFNLTVDSATFNDDNTTFKCDDGSISDSITIEVVPAYSENKTNINDTDEGKQVEFTTACVHPDVEFDWFTVKVDNSNREPYQNGQNENTDIGECSIDSNCGGVGTVNVASVVMIPTVPTFVPKEERYLGVVVKYKNPVGERTFRFNELFHFEDCKLRCCYIIVLIYSIRWIFLMSFYFAGSLCAWWEISCQKSVLVCIGNIPILGPCCSAFFLFHKQKDLTLNLKYFDMCCWIRVRLIVCWFCDSCLFIVMILTCTDIIKKQCLIYAVYAPFTLLFPLINFGCLERDLKKHTGNNKTGNVSKHQTDPIAVNKDFDVHVDIVEIKGAKIGPEWTCSSCNQQQQIYSKLENKCIFCKQTICKTCKQEHLKIHNAIRTTHMQKHSPKGLEDSVSLADTNRITDYCVCSNSRNKSQRYCLSCQRYLCKLCFRKHDGHSILKDQHEEKRFIGHFECSRGRNNAESYCLKCQQYLCKWCITNHAGHRIIRHCQQEAGEKQCQIFCDLCEKETEAKYYSRGKKRFVCEDCKSGEGPKDIIAVDDLFFHSENNIESYCLSCQQYLCSLCFTKHAEHRILRHSQQETKLDESHRSNLSKGTGYKPDRRDRNTLGVSLAFEIPRVKYTKAETKLDESHRSNLSKGTGYKPDRRDRNTLGDVSQAFEIPQVKYTKAVAGNARCHILCKYCQNLSIKADAKYYSKIDNSFFCEDGKPEIGLEDIIVEDGHGWKCRCSINPVECKEMNYNEKLCAACFEHTVIEEGIRHRKMCALHSGLSVKTYDVTELPADVLCLVCNEYLCKMCFKQHLHLKQLWLRQHPDEEKLKQQASRITSILQENRQEYEEDFNLVIPFDDEMM